MSIWLRTSEVSSRGSVSNGASATPGGVAIVASGYELLTATLPYGRGSFVDIVLRQVEPPPALARDDVPEALASAVSSALAPDPAARPPSATAFADLLRGVAETTTPP